MPKGVTCVATNNKILLKGKINQNPISIAVCPAVCSQFIYDYVN